MTSLVVNRLTNWILCVIFVLILTIVYLPILVMIIFSFNSGRYQTLPFREFTTYWYARTLQDQSFIEGMATSLTIAAGASCLATTLGFFAAYSFHRAQIPAKSVLYGIVLAPLAVPLILIGIGMRLQLNELGLQPGLWLVLLGQTVYVLPLAVLNLRVRIASIPSSLEDAAMSLGAGRLRAISEIIAPACGTTLFATMLLTFTFAFDEFVIAYFLTNFEVTLPIKIWTTLVTGFDPTVNAVGTGVFLFSVTLGLAAQILLVTRQSGR